LTGFGPKERTVRNLLLAVLILIAVAALFVSPLLDMGNLRNTTRSGQDRTELRYHGNSHLPNTGLAARPAFVFDE
jgi:hypothetical protein